MVAMIPIQVTVELLIGSTWVDISTFVYHRNPITITGGKSSSSDTQSPATLTLTVNNRDGRFSPLYSGGAYYPNLKRNVQIRVSATAQSSSGNYFTGYRFWGEVTRWPPLNDISGRDVWVDVTAHGPLRRLREGGGQGSALDRYYQMLTGSLAPIAYWPCEEDPRFGGFLSTTPGVDEIGTGLSNGTPMTVSGGSPAWKANNSFNGSAPIPVLNGSTWDGLTGQFNSSGDDIYNVAGTYKWVASTTTVNVKVWGGGGGGENGPTNGVSVAGGGSGGGGGEFAQNTTLAVTPGTAYTVVVGSGGSGGNYNNPPGGGTDNPGQSGGLSKMTGDVASVTAHGGLGGTNGTGGTGGTGSTAPVHFNGGAGAAGTGFSAGCGGGGSGGTAAGGNAGSNASGGGVTGGAGGVAVTGGGGGGRGGDFSPRNAGASGGHIPGGGGGGGTNAAGGAAYAGQSGADGKVELVYTPSSGGTLPSANVIRFVIQVPAHGGNPGKVLLRIKTSSAVLDHLDVTYASGGKFRLQGFNSSNVQQFDSTALSWTVDGNPLMVSVELANSGPNVNWAFKTITPGAGKLRNSTSGTVSAAQVGNVIEVTAGPNGDITKTALGHISVQYALIDLRKVSKALHGHHAELGIDRFIRLCNEQAMANVPEFNETADHWGFEASLQGWTAVNAAATRVTTTASGDVPWDFAGNGTGGSGIPADKSYVIVTTGQAASISAGDQVVSKNNPGQIFTVYNVSYPFAGFNNIYVRPMAANWMDSTDTVTQVVNAGLTDPNIPVFPVHGAHSMLLTCNGALTGDASTFEGGIANWTAAGNCAVAQTAAQAHAGTKSLALTSTAAGNMAAAHCTAGNVTTQGLVCAAGQVIAASAWFRTAVSARSANIGVDFYDSGGTVIGSTLRGADVTDSATGWTQATASVTAPASSAFCRANVQVKSAGAGAEVHYADDVLLNGYPSATAPTGTSGQPVSVGDIVSVAADFFTPGVGTGQTGAFLDEPGMGTADFNAASAVFNGWTGATLRVSRSYLAPSVFTYTARLGQMAAAGVKVLLSLRPAYNPVSATDLANMTTLLQTMQANQLDAEITLWHEPYYAGLTSAQYIAMVNYYGPTVRQYYPLVFCTSLSSVVNNNENSFYPGDSAVDKIATDYYAVNFVNGYSLSSAATIADTANPPKPFGIWEYNGLVSGGNFLVQPNSGFETNSAGTWTNAGNCTIAASSAQAYAGAWSLALTSAAAGNMAAAHCTAGNILTQGLPCVPGDSIQQTTRFRSAVSARTCQSAVAFYTAAGAAISTLTGTGVADTTSGWTATTATVTAPATAAFCRANPGVLATGAASEVHYIDDVTLTNLNTGYNTTQITNFFGDIQTYMTGRLAAGLQNADVLLFNGTGPNSTEIVSGSDFRIALHQATYSALNSVPSSAAALPAAYAGIKWYTAAGAACAHAEDDGDDTAIDPGDVVTLKAKFTAPATAAFFAPVVGDHHADVPGTLIYVDHVRVSPRMGPQTRRHLHQFLEEIEDLDQGILKEWKHAWGHGYRTRFRLINQTPAVTLDYAQGMLSPPLAPIVDQQNVKNDITVRRHKGSKHHTSLESGGSGAGTAEPPAGAGRKKHLYRVVAEEDAQLAALAQHLLNLGTVTDERFPTVTVNLLRCAIAGHPIAPLMSAIARAETGDMIQLTSLPFWFPAATAKQLIIGYYEELSPYVWNVTWNCVPESPWGIVATSTRRW